MVGNVFSRTVPKNSYVVGQKKTSRLRIFLICLLIKSNSHHYISLICITYSTISTLPLRFLSLPVPSFLAVGGRPSIQQNSSTKYLRRHWKKNSRLFKTSLWPELIIFVQKSQSFFCSLDSWRALFSGWCLCQLEKEAAANISPTSIMILSISPWKFALV